MLFTIVDDRFFEEIDQFQFLRTIEFDEIEVGDLGLALAQEKVQKALWRSFGAMTPAQHPLLRKVAQHYLDQLAAEKAPSAKILAFWSDQIMNREVRGFKGTEPDLYRKFRDIAYIHGLIGLIGWPAFTRNLVFLEGEPRIFRPRVLNEELAWREGLVPITYKGHPHLIAFDRHGYEAKVRLARYQFRADGTITSDSPYRPPTSPLLPGVDPNYREISAQLV